MYHSVESWGRFVKANPASVRALYDRKAPLSPSKRPMLAFGNGRSYSDVCLNNGGDILLARGLDRFIHFDPAKGILRAEAGLLLSEVLELIVPQGWFLPVSPGTRFATLGGALANDVHGKNHHRAGSFGRHVRALELLRSDGTRRVCSARKWPDWFAATIGGLGLTGLITWVEIQLRPIEDAWIEVERIGFPDLEGFFELSARSDQSHEYTVAWVDSTAKGRALGRGLFLRGNHASLAPRSGSGAISRQGRRRHRCEDLPPPRRPAPGAASFLKAPFTLPIPLVNQCSVRLFNAIYYRSAPKQYLSHYEPFFYPLDKLGHWNRIYGPKGFLQYQCVLPLPEARPALKELLGRIAISGEGSFLTVLKVFGKLTSPGLLSFPRPGVTVALDFPFRDNRTLALMDSLDEVVLQAGGALYPAKDARMNANMFRLSFPMLDRFRAYVDRQFSSDFWRRLDL